jgi:signal transduction histidine kinase
VVRDTGQGLDEAQRARLFRRFARVEDSATPGVGGLGLAISRELVLAMGGRIAAERAPEAGACFVVELPLDAAGP